MQHVSLSVAELDMHTVFLREMCIYVRIAYVWCWVRYPDIRTDCEFIPR